MDYNRYTITVISDVSFFDDLYTACIDAINVSEEGRLRDHGNLGWYIGSAYPRSFSMESIRESRVDITARSIELMTVIFNRFLSDVTSFDTTVVGRDVIPEDICYYTSIERNYPSLFNRFKATLSNNNIKSFNTTGRHIFLQATVSPSMAIVLSTFI